VYPTLRRKPARLGDTQSPSNCQLSAASGLPALGLPAGFTDDGLPVGMDLLARAFREEDLLSLGYSIEQTMKLRRPPFSTPALIDGKRPAARRASVTFLPKASVEIAAEGAGAVLEVTYDEPAARMDYSLRIQPAVAERMYSVWIHSGTVEKPGAARHELFGTGRSTKGSITVSAADRADLAEGRLIVRLYLRGVKGSAGDAALSFQN